MFTILTTLLFSARFVLARGGDYNAAPYGHLPQGDVVANTSSPTVNLGYSTFEGFVNETANLNIFLGIPFTQPPIGKLRWQPPQAPLVNQNGTKNATSYGAICFQSLTASNGSIQPDPYNTNASEDCLFINVWAPNNVTELLPVMIYIHGGGYGGGDGQQDLTPLITTNYNTFVGVTIQYRLGAFGFLSSADVHNYGTPNAGLLDQHMALHWVQQYIHHFGGNKSHVTITGESAGAGAVMLQDLAYGGTLGETLFINSLAASPYLPLQFGYDDNTTTSHYDAFAVAAGCPTSDPSSSASFDCLVNSTTEVLSVANNDVQQTGLSSTYVFLPVTDGEFLQELPGKQLLQNKVNGRNGLFGNNADEGVSFVPANITTQQDLVAYIKRMFPLFTSNDISRLLDLYPGPSTPDNPNAPHYATDGTNPPYAITQGSYATGHQERADLIYGETTFICPSYWLAQAYNSQGKTGYKYQFSVPPALHALDTSAYFSYPSQGPYESDLIYAFSNIWGNFIVSGNPSISNSLANGLSTGNSSFNPISEWPPYLNNSASNPLESTNQIDLNTTCTSQEFLFLTPVCVGANQISLANAYTWEGGRGKRCEFWRSVGQVVPE